MKRRKKQEQDRRLLKGEIRKGKDIIDGGKVIAPEIYNALISNDLEKMKVFIKEGKCDFHKQYKDSDLQLVNKHFRHLYPTVANLYTEYDGEHTILSIAIVMNYINMVELFLQNGALINRTLCWFKKPIFFANTIEMASFLMRCGADISEDFVEGWDGRIDVLEKSIELNNVELVKFYNEKMKFVEKKSFNDFCPHYTSYIIRILKRVFTCSWSYEVWNERLMTGVFLSDEIVNLFFNEFLGVCKKRWEIYKHTVDEVSPCCEILDVLDELIETRKSQHVNNLFFKLIDELKVLGIKIPLKNED